MTAPAPRRPPILLMIALAVIAVVGLLLLTRDDPRFRLGDDGLPRLALLVGILVFVGAGMFGRALRPGEIVRAIAAWATVIIVLVGIYATRDQLAGVAGRLLAAVAPGVPVTGRLAGEANPESVMVMRSADGHFAVLASVEKKPLLFLVDTGASFVTLAHADAKTIGIDTDALTYDLPIRTANGTMIAAPVTIGSITVGSIERRQVKALVAPEGVLDQSLLGMTFLNTLNGYAIAGDRLVLTP
jgi:aspartyl protease family protein